MNPIISPETLEYLYDEGAHFVFADSNKKPIAKAWEQTRPTLKQTQTMYGRGYLIGLITASIGCLVIDIDKKSSVPTDVIRESVIESLGPPLCEISTQSGGIHLFYRTDAEGKGNQKWHHPNDPKTEAGDIRHKRGFVVLWNADGLAAALENIDDYAMVDLNAWPIARPKLTTPQKQTQTQPTKERKFNEEEIVKMLSHIDPDDKAGGYDQWMAIGAVLSREGLPMSVWQNWSKKGKSYNEEDFTPARWEGFKNVSGEKATMGTIVALAMNGGYSPPRPDVKATEMSSVRQSKHFSNLAEEWQLPVHLTFDHLEDSDSDRILRYCAEQLLRLEDNSVVMGSLGLWHELTSASEFAKSAMRALVKNARSTAAREVTTRVDDVLQGAEYSHFLQTGLPTGSVHVRYMTDQVSQRILANQAPAVITSSTEEFDDRVANPVLPLQGGGGFDLRTGKAVSVEELGRLKFFHHGWGMPEPEPAILEKTDDPAVNEMKTAIIERFSDNLITRLAYHFLGLDKAVDLIIAPTNWGKSTLITILQKAFPGMVGRLAAVRAFSRQGTRFSQIERVLTEKILCILDEGGQKDPDRKMIISPAALNMLVDDELPVELKGQDNIFKRRLGTAIIIGHTWPQIESDEQGTNTRFHWAHMVGSDYTPMTRDQRETLLSPSALSYFRTLVCLRAVWIHQQGGAAELTYTDRSRDAVATFMLARSDPIVTALRDHYEEGDPKLGVSYSSVKEMLESISDSRFTADAITEKISTAFHSSAHIRFGRPYVNGEQTRGWFGLREKGTTQAECNLCGTYAALKKAGGQWVCADGSCYQDF